MQIYEKINLELRLYTSNSEGEKTFGGTNEEVQVSGWEKVNLQTRGLHKDPFWGFSGVRGLILTFSIFLLPPLFFFLLYFCVRLCIHSKMHCTYTPSNELNKNYSNAGLFSAVRSRSILRNGKFCFIIEYIDSVKLLNVFSHDLTCTHKLNLEGVVVCREE